ncbi:MAG: cation transporter [Faecalibacterium sp.]|nr:cation transporter [Ruminococcus sp.]MCM1391149.1 cation transporter [Ruminococcus sp.]MCM1486237.1 cation transporter [Faecalibacterium sp.]
MLKLTVKIDGMACSMCENHVCDVIRSNFKIKKVTASHKKATAVILTKENISDEQLTSAIGKTGYKVISVERKEEQDKKKGLFGLHI